MKVNRGLIALVAGLVALGFFIMSFVYWAALAATTFSFNLGSMDLTLRILLVITIISFTVFVIASPEAIGQAAKTRSTRLTANALVMSIVAIAIAVVLNVIIGAVPTVRADWTTGKQFTLSDQTSKILSSLQQNVEAVGFFDPVQEAQSQKQAQDLLKEYTARTSRLKYRFIDPFTDPVSAQLYGVNRSGVVVFVEGQRHETATAIDEKDFSSAIYRLNQTGPNTVAFVTGHGERDINGSDANGFSQAKQSLTDNNYTVVVWSLTTTPTIPINQVAALVIAQPQRAYTDKEIAAIKQYVDAGGHLMMLLDPAMPAQVLAPLQTLAAGYGIGVTPGIVYDVPARLDPNYPFLFGVSTYPGSDITSDLSRNRFPTVFLQAMEATPLTDTKGLNVVPVIATMDSSPNAWLRKDISDTVAAFNASKDVGGPINIAAAAAPTEPTGTEPVTQANKPTLRVLVYGDADWASNGALQQLSQFDNTDLLINSVSWLAGANALIAIAPKAADAPRNLTLTQTDKNVVFTSAVLALPLVVLLIGGLTWWRRR